MRENRGVIIFEKKGAKTFQCLESRVTKNLKQKNKRKKVASWHIIATVKRRKNKLLRLAIYKTTTIEEKNVITKVNDELIFDHSVEIMEARGPL